MKIVAHLSAALFLIASLAAGATQVITAPQGNQGACPFPGCKSTAAGADITDAPFNVSPGPADMSGRIQMAIDSGMPILVFPPGVYTMCNVQPRALNQKWIGAGPGQSFIQGTAGCTNPIATSFGGVFGGPTASFDVEGFTFQQTAGNDLNLQCRDMAAHVVVRNNAFDTCTQTGTTAQGILIAGCRDFVIEDNEFYSTCPGKGKGILANGIRGGTIRRNVFQWVNEAIEIGTTTNQPTEFTNVSDNLQTGPFWGIPTKYTNSGGNVTYSGTGMADATGGLSLSGLCGDTGSPGSCSGNGNFIRVLTSKVAGTAGTFNTAGGYLTDATVNFTAASVLRGDIIKTTPLCLGNGGLSQAKRFSCTGNAATASWGDSCVCTANADCGSGICEPRWATVDTVGDTHNIQVDEWVRETACPLGTSTCAIATRRPTGAPLSTAGIAYTIFGWTACQIASYTASAVTCNTDNWFTWGGSASTPSNGALYEIMYARPLYFLLVGNTASLTATQGIRAENNAVVGGFADNFELFGSQNIVVGNHARDCGDTCFVVEGNKNTVTGNIADHCGARGILMLGDDSTLTANVAFDSPWVRVSNTTTAGDLNVLGNRNTLSDNKAIAATPTNLNRYGIVSFGNATGNTDQTNLIGNTCAGTYTVGCYRLDATGGTTTNNRIVGYHGEVISNNGGTFSIEGGLTTEALLVANAAQAGSYCGCSDCTIASPTAAGGTGAMAIRSSTGPQWNGR